MYQTIKEIAERCVQSNLVFQFSIATVKSSTELVLDQGLVLPVEPCLVLESVGGLKMITEEGIVELKRPVEVGDQLLLLNIGNTYCVLGRMGSLFDQKVV